MNAVAAFLERDHEAVWEELSVWAHDTLAPRPEAMSDEAARNEARALLTQLGAGGWLEPVRRQDLRALCLTREAVATASPLADAVIAIQALAATTLILGGSDQQRRAWLDRILSGQAMAAFALTEPEAGSDAAAVQTQARREDKAWILNGEKHLISNAGIADIYVVFASTTPERKSRGISAFLVPADTPGLQFAGAQPLAAAHPLGHLKFVDCRVGSDALIGDADQGFKLAMKTLDRLRPTVGAAACGMATRALAEATWHARTRRQFGQPLADFQLVRAQLGRMATELDAARLLVYRAAWESDRGEVRISASAAMAKSFATEAAQRIVDSALQIIGGRGILLGHPVEHLYRAVRALRIYEGATDILRLVVGNSIVDQGTHG